MDNPISSSLANFVVEDLITTCLNYLSCEINFMKLYIDYTIMAVPEKHCKQNLNIFNNYHAKLKFTMEVKIDRNILFLDVLIAGHPNGALKTSCYEKPINFGRILNFLSNHLI